MITIVITRNQAWTSNEDTFARMITFNEFSHDIESHIHIVQKLINSGIERFTSHQYLIVYLFKLLVKKGIIANNDIQMRYYTDVKQYETIQFGYDGTLSKYPDSLAYELLMELL